MQLGRIGWIDVARGMGIICVVAGHVWDAPLVHRTMFMFHMPFFFALSGMLFKQRHFRAFIDRKTKALFVPYISFIVVIMATDVLLSHIYNTPPFLPIDHPSHAIAHVILGGEWLVGIYGVFWFVTCLFLVEMSATIAFIYLGSPSLGKGWVALLAACMMAAYLIPARMTPWDALVVPMAFVFFVAGWAYRQANGLERISTSGSLALLAIAVAGEIFASPMDMKYQRYGTPIATVVVALAASHILCRAAHHLANFSLARAPIAEIGRASLVIMFMHLTVFYALRQYVSGLPMVFLATLLPWFFYRLVNAFAFGRWLFLGGRGSKNQASLAT